MKGWWKGRRMRAGLTGVAGLGLLVCGFLAEHPAIAGLCAGLGIAVLGLAVSRLSQLFALRGAPEDRLRIEWAKRTVPRGWPGLLSPGARLRNG